MMSQDQADSNPVPPTNSAQLEIATLAGGCFWCLEPPYDSLPGVVNTVVGYTGGHVANPSYDAVCSGTTGHTEAVQITFDPKRISYRHLLDTFWRNIDPTALNRQFFDVGSQYRTALFFHSEDQRIEAEKSLNELQASGRFSQPIVTRIEPATLFYPAEAYHQDYYQKCPIPYSRYKQGSGREAFLKKHWGNK